MTFEIFYVYVGIYQFTFLTLSPRLNLKLEDVLLRVHVIQMAGRARRGQNERVPPPPPPPPTLQELMAQQNEILRQLAQRQPPPQHYGGGDHQRHPAAATYQEFLSTQPPLFTRAEDPLDADVWLRVVESKFPLLHGVCSEVTKVRFATQQLRGPARTWWDHFLAMQPDDREVEWREFKAAFRGHHIPAGIMDRKLNEFLALTQGNRTVLQYAQAFNDLCQYAGQIQTRRRETGLGGGSALSSVTVSTPSGPTTIMSWSTWPSLKRTVSQLVRQKRRARPLWQDPQLSHSALGLCPTLRTGDPSSSKGDG
jgi:hypothetical protein